MSTQKEALILTKLWESQYSRNDFYLMYVNCLRCMNVPFLQLLSITCAFLRQDAYVMDGLLTLPACWRVEMPTAHRGAGGLSWGRVCNAGLIPTAVLSPHLRLATPQRPSRWEGQEVAAIHLSTWGYLLVNIRIPSCQHKDTFLSTCGCLLVNMRLPSLQYKDIFLSTQGYLLVNMRQPSCQHKATYLST